MTNKRHAALTSTFTNVLAPYAKLKKLFSIRFVSANSPQRIARAACGIARAVAVLVSLSMGISLSIPMQAADGGQDKLFSSSKELIKYVANKQLSDKEYKCHNEIIYRESRWNDKAIGNKQGTKQAYGLYQLKINSMRTAHPEIQFWKYWEYVSYRYGITQYDEPMYCAALHHLKTKGWQ